jgi:hypothetical protein
MFVIGYTTTASALVGVIEQAFPEAILFHVSLDCTPELVVTQPIAALVGTEEDLAQRAPRLASFKARYPCVVLMMYMSGVSDAWQSVALRQIPIEVILTEGSKRQPEGVRRALSVGALVATKYRVGI